MRFPTRHRQRGSALTEFVIIVPLILAIVYGSIYLSDAGIFRLKAQEIARYSAWSLAVRPMSDYQDFDHQEALRKSSESARDELFDVYQDLDAAHRRFPGREAQTMVAAYLPPTSSDLRVRPVQSVPGAINAEWSSPLSGLGMVLSILGIGNSVQDLFSGPDKKLGFNPNGEVHGRARVNLLPPIRPHDAQRAHALARAGAIRGADLSRFEPRGRTISEIGANAGHRGIETVLVADSWRLNDGATAKPSVQGPYANAVGKLSDKNALSALPLGAIFAQVQNLVVNVTRLPTLDYGGVFDGHMPKEVPPPSVFSRPHTQIRHRSRPPKQAGSPARGQMNAVRDTDANTDYWESGAVRNFETTPMYVDHSGHGAYADVLEQRGQAFMGCPHEQERRCSAW